MMAGVSQRVVSRDAYIPMPRWEANNCSGLASASDKAVGVGLTTVSQRRAEFLPARAGKFKNTEANYPGLQLQRQDGGNKRERLFYVVNA